MRFLIIVKADAASEAGAMPQESLSAAMADYHQTLSRAGVLLDAAGLQPSSRGWRIDYADGRRRITEGPFPLDSAGGLAAGYTLIQVRTREEALEWSRRFPPPRGAAAPAQIEVRPLCEPDGYAPGASGGRSRRLPQCADASAAPPDGSA
jgi:hypothetical protein